MLQCHVLEVELFGSDRHDKIDPFFELIIRGQDPKFLLMKTATWIENLNNLLFSFQFSDLLKTNWFWPNALILLLKILPENWSHFCVFMCSFPRNTEFPNFLDEGLILMNNITSIEGNILDLSVS